MTTRNSLAVDLCVFDLLQWAGRNITQGQWTIAVRGTQEIIGYGLALMTDSIYSRNGFPGSRSSFSGWCTIRKQVQFSVIRALIDKDIALIYLKCLVFCGLGCVCALSVFGYDKGEVLLLSRSTLDTE